jgi:hypothetical protein
MALLRTGKQPPTRFAVLSGRLMRTIGRFVSKE